MLPTDWSAPSSSVLRRLSDGRVQQHWDPDHVLATRMKTDARPPQPEQDCCVRSGILWDLAAVYPAGAAWSDRMPTATVFNGPVVDVIPAIENALLLARQTTSAAPATESTLAGAASSGRIEGSQIKIAAVTHLKTSRLRRTERADRRRRGGVCSVHSLCWARSATRRRPS